MSGFGADRAAMGYIGVTDTHQGLVVDENVRAAAGRERRREVAGVAGANVCAAMGLGQCNSSTIETKNTFAP